MVCPASLVSFAVAVFVLHCVSNEGSFIWLAKA